MSNYPFFLQSGSASALSLDTLFLSSANAFGAPFFFNVQ
ncbi:putative membrane protein [Vibrio sp. HENC-03]|nr:putative membrane protein [Vibrio sp. HENC-03]